MPAIMKVTAVEAHSIQLTYGEALLSVAALGEVSTTGWTAIRLLQRFYAAPPPDGVQEFDLVGDVPIETVGEVVLPVGALFLGRTPPWCTGVRVYAEGNNIEAPLGTGSAAKAKPKQTSISSADRAIINQTVASYDDSHQPTGTIHWKNDGPFGAPVPHAEWKKLHHDLTLIVEGPSEAKIRDCIQKAMAAGLIAAIVAAISTGGGGLSAAISAAMHSLIACLGNGYTVNFRDNSYWIYWDT